MQPTDDSALLRQFVETHSDEAFAALVTRHLNLVYSVALRQVGQPHNAEEITQAVFIILAKKAAGLRHQKALTSWLFHTTRLTANNFVRSEMRRRRREQEAHMQVTLNGGSEASMPSNPDEMWAGIAPWLDSAVASLREKDRRAILLRFYEGRNLREVAAALNIKEPAAQKRVSRALEKLRRFFLKRGVDSTTTAIAETISAHSIQAAPVALAKTISAVALAKGAAASTTTLTLIKGALKIMAWTKIKTAIVTATVVVLAAGTTTVIVNQGKMFSSSIPSWADDPKYWDLDFNNPDATGQRIARLRPVLVLRPTRFPNGFGFMSFGDKMVGKRQPISQLIVAAYDPARSHRLVLPKDFRINYFDIMLTLPSQQRPLEKLQEELQRHLGLVAHFETNEMDVLLLTRTNPIASGLIPTAGKESSVTWDTRNNKLTISNWPLTSFASQFDSILQIPVFDQTEINGNYDCTISWKQRPGESTNDAFKRAVSEQLGFEFESGRKVIKKLVVEKAK